MVTVNRALRVLVGSVILVVIAAPIQAAKYQIVYAFKGGSDGANPLAAVIAVDHTLYGTTLRGGGSADCTGGCGTVFSLDAATGAEMVVHSFGSGGGGDGLEPAAALVNVEGALYGTTQYGGPDGHGTVFSIAPTTGAESIVHYFTFRHGPILPNAALTKVGGRLYGTSPLGGDCRNRTGCGTVFLLHPTTGAEKTVHSFLTGGDGVYPIAGLIKVGHALFGTTRNGGTASSCRDCGTVFSLDAATGAERVVYSFHGGDGKRPLAGLIQVAGTLYGTTELGGAAGRGTVFALNPSTGAERVVYSFQGGADAAYPGASLVEVHGVLYGTTIFGDGSTPGSDGTVFSVDPATGGEKVLHTFGGGTDGDGAYPYANLVEVAGKLYGTTESSGVGGNGTVFAITP